MNVYKLIYDYIDGADVKYVIAKSKPDCAEFYDQSWKEPWKHLRVFVQRKTTKGEKRGVLIDTKFY